MCISIGCYIKLANSVQTLPRHAGSSQHESLGKTWKSVWLSYPLVLRRRYDAAIKHAKLLALTVFIANICGELGQYFTVARRSLVLDLNFEVSMFHLNNIYEAAFF